MQFNWVFHLQCFFLIPFLHPDLYFYSVVHFLPVVRLVLLVFRFFCPLCQAETLLVLRRSHPVFLLKENSTNTVRLCTEIC